MRSFVARWLVLSLLAPFVAVSALAAADASSVAATDSMPSPLSSGDGVFEFSGWKGPTLRVFYHLPARVTAATPVVFVMHGRGRDADRYRNEWSPLAESNRFILAVPEFDEARFPGGESYNHGRFRDKDGRIRPREQWSFSAIEPLFDEVKVRTGTHVETYAIYGHSAGAQFVHRFALFMPEARFHAAVSANAGSYAMPVFDVDFPFGLRGSPVDTATLKRSLGKPMVVLLGTADVDPNHQSLPRQPEAMAQGSHRLARGQAFYEKAKAVAEQLDTPFRWQLRYAEGIAHSNGGMAKFAAAFLGEGAATP